HAGERKVFEKFYRKGSVDWVKVSFFMDCHATGVDPSKVLIPMLVTSVSGEGLVVSHSDYVDVQNINPSDYFYLALACMAELSRLRLVPSAPELLFDVMLHTGFARCYRKTLEFANEVGGAQDVL